MRLVLLRRELLKKCECERRVSVVSDCGLVIFISDFVLRNQRAVR